MNVKQTIIAALTILGCSAALAAPEWYRAVEVDSVEIYITEVTRSEMRATVAEYGGERGHMGIARAGFSVLGRTAEGEYACLVFVRDIHNQRAVEHEERHCYGWAHE